MFVTKLVVKQATTGYQMKGIDIIFLVSTGIPLVYSGLSGLDTTDFESQSFFHNAQK